MTISEAHVRPLSLAERGAAVLPIALGITFAMFRIVNSDPVDRSAGPLVPIAFAAVYAIPGPLALRAGRRRPALFLAAGLLATVLAFTSFAGVTLPLLIPAGMSLISYGRREGEARGRPADPVVALICLVLGMASFLAPFAHKDPRCVSTPRDSSCSSDVITAAEAGLAIACAAATVAVGSALSRPRSEIAVSGRPSSDSRSREEP